MLLLIDNYDSFTYNLVQYLRQLGAEVAVYRNDQISAKECIALQPTHLVISPGPCTPDQSGISIELIKYFSDKIPILGVCLGHQAIAQAFGARIQQAQRIMHGKLSNIKHNKSILFNDMPDTFNVTRYHSLTIDESTLADCFDISARSIDEHQPKEIMAIQHKALPISGVQFHPEAILTEYGHQLLSNFLQQSAVTQ
ncbi:MAG: aminodeoxychorismate/anthranilate synthase component II [Coxiellaceae bacterium]|nr:aminodeoxychorismate/anthranilate synthase component II [Coxiellaceae bacterium]